MENHGAISSFDWTLRVLTLVALIGVAGLIVHQARGLSDARDEIRRLMTRIDELEARSKAPLPPDSRMGAWATQAAASISRPVPSAMPPEVPSPEQMERVEASRQRDLAAVFAAETPAPSSDPTPQQVMQVFRSAAVEGALDAPESEDVSCRKQTCLIRASFHRGADSSDWTTRLMLELGRVLPSYRTVNVLKPDGSFELQVYAQRGGGGDS